MKRQYSNSNSLPVEPRESETPRIKRSVFILFSGDSDATLSPTGTAFAISANLALIAYHCSIDSSKPPKELAVLVLANAIIPGEAPQLVSPRRVQRTHYFDRETDWALVQVSADKEFGDFLDICSIAELPQVDGANNLVRTCYAPVNLFYQHSVAYLEINMEDWRRVMQYDGEFSGDPGMEHKYCSLLNVSDSTVITAREELKMKYLVLPEGLYGGCCGSPYILQSGKVAAFHLYSADESVSIKGAIERANAHAAKKRRTSEILESGDADSVTEKFTSCKRGLILCKLPIFVSTYRILFGKDLNSAIR